MQLGVKFPNTDQGPAQPSWLGSSHGMGSAATVTLDATAFTAFVDEIPSGIPLKKVGNKHVPVSAVGDTVAGYLLTDQPFDGERDVVAPMIERGKIRVRHLPTGAFDVTTLETPNPLFILDTEGA